MRIAYAERRRGRQLPRVNQHEGSECIAMRAPIIGDFSCLFKNKNSIRSEDIVLHTSWPVKTDTF